MWITLNASWHGCCWIARVASGQIWGGLLAGVEWPSGRSGEYQNGGCGRMATGRCAEEDQRRHFANNFAQLFFFFFNSTLCSASWLRDCRPLSISLLHALSPVQYRMRSACQIYVNLRSLAVTLKLDVCYIIRMRAKKLHETFADSDEQDDAQPRPSTSAFHAEPSPFNANEAGFTVLKHL